MKMKERLYLTEDKLRVVKEDDRAGRHLLCKKGAELDDKVALEYGLVDGSLFGKVLATIEIIAPETKRVKKPVTQKSTKVKKVATKSTGRVIMFGGGKKGSKK